MARSSDGPAPASAATSAASAAASCAVASMPASACTRQARPSPCASPMAFASGATAVGPTFTSMGTRVEQSLPEAVSAIRRSTPAGPSRSEKSVSSEMAVDPPTRGPASPPR